MINNIRDFLLQYEYFERNGTLVNVNYLDQDVGDFSIEPVPTKPLIKSYINGDKIKQYEFALISKNSYSEDVTTNIENCGFFEDFEAWIEECNDNDILPTLDKNMESRSIEIVNNGILVDNSSGECIYQITLRLVYFKPHI